MKSFVIIVVSIFGLFVMVTAVQVYTYARRDDTQDADAAIVLGAAVFDDKPSPVLRERINHAILLYELGYVDFIIFTGGKGQAGQMSEAEVSAEYARLKGVPDEAVLLETTSTNTVQNLANAQKVAASYNLDTFLIVSTPFHMRRALSIAADLDMEAYTSPTRTIQWISWFTKTRAYVQEVGSYILYYWQRI